MFTKESIIWTALVVLVRCEDEVYGDSVANFEVYDCSNATIYSNCTTAHCQDKICHCNVSVGYYYNETLKGCEFNLKLLLNSLVNKYDTKEQILKDSVEIFRGIEIAAIIVVICASVGFIAGCFYCFRMKYKDAKLKSEVAALLKSKMRPVVHPDQGAKRQLLPIEESCNVVVEGAGIFVV